MTTEPDPTNLDMIVALGKLTMDEREALVDHVVRYETYEQIAARLGCSRQAVGMMIARAKTKLRRELA